MSGTVIDLFSCVGGHALGYTREGYKPVLFVEKNKHRQKVLAKQFPGIPVCDRIERVEWAHGDVLIGGPPCQATSVAAAIHGKRTGESLWSEMRRVMYVSSYEWGIIEQPPGNKAWEAQVQRDLEADGRAVKWITITAKELGYPYIRRRRFAIACRDVQRLESAWASISSQIEALKRTASARRTWLLTIPRIMRMADGHSRGMDRRERIEAIGDSNPPEMIQVIFRAIKQSGGDGIDY
jgi:site-specific DNA-cytosine methylase